MLTSPDGVLVVDKPSGPTSFDIVAQVRRQLGTRQVGHAGTLDPMATGVLVVMVGQATKLSDYLTVADKTYLAEIQFGCSTDTLDITGTTVSSHPLESGWLTPQKLELALEKERSRIAQVPPQFSAIKQAGKKSYAQARQGHFVQHAPRAVKVHHLNLTRFDDTHLELELRVSKGYYVRALARDLCETLGVAGCLSRLRRTASGSFGLGHICPWPPTPESLLSTAEAARAVLPHATLTAAGVTRARHGKRLTAVDFDEPPAQELCAWYSSDGRLIALGQPQVRPEARELDAASPSGGESVGDAALVGSDDVAFQVVRGFR